MGGVSRPRSFGDLRESELQAFIHRRVGRAAPGSVGSRFAVQADRTPAIAE
jgi:hypothetical protein